MKKIMLIPLMLCALLIIAEPNFLVYASSETSSSIDKLNGELINVLSKLGVTEVNNISIGEYNITSSGGDIDVYCTVDDDIPMKIHCMYIELIDRWTILYVSDEIQKEESETESETELESEIESVNNNRKYYYLPDGEEVNYDLYDWKTGELISEGIKEKK